nr:pilin [Halomonas ventosae]
MARAQATEALNLAGGLRIDIAEQFTQGTTFASMAEATSPLATSAQTLEGEYVDATGVSIDATPAPISISVDFARGVHTGDTLTLTPTLNAASDQIASWTCAGLDDVNHMPSACR